MSCIAAATTILSIYIVVESIDAIINMDGGLSEFCHKVKYSTAPALAVSAVYYVFAGTNGVTWFSFFVVLSLALFVWPRTVWRVRKYLKELDEREAS